MDPRLRVVYHAVVALHDDFDTLPLYCVFLTAEALGTGRALEGEDVGTLTR
jgi:hypothetical protein